MKALQAYIDQQNRWNSLFSGNCVVFEVQTQSGREFVARHIDSALSPENLSCDGELNRQQVQIRYRILTHAARDLIQLDPTMAEFIYEFA
jgi:hypothetical protein